MMRILFLSIACFATSLLVGCGILSDYAPHPAKITFAAWDPAGQMAGGVMAYLFPTDTGSTSPTHALPFSNISAATEAEFVVPNISFRVVAFGYSDPNMGGLKCGMFNGGAPTAFTGTYKDLKIDLSEKYCAAGDTTTNYPQETPFTTVSGAQGTYVSQIGYTYQIKTLTIQSCSGQTFASNPTLGCAAGTIKAVRLRFQPDQFFPQNAQSDNASLRTVWESDRRVPPQSHCMPLDAGGLIATGMQVPIGNQSTFFPLVLELYDSASACSDTAGTASQPYAYYRLHHGIAGVGHKTPQEVEVYSGHTTQRVTLTEGTPKIYADPGLSPSVQEYTIYLADPPTGANNVVAAPSGASDL